MHLLMQAILLQTQIARTYGIRRNFLHAQQILADIEPQNPSVPAWKQCVTILSWDEPTAPLHILQSHRQLQVEVARAAPPTCTLLNLRTLETLTVWRLTLFI